VTLPRQQHKAHQIAERVDERCNLCRQAAARLADGLILSPPFAPVPC
jgi:coenzyme F420-reducing hydrogenase beta subunit